MKITTKLSVGIVQFNPVWHEPSTNFDQIEKLVTKEAQNLDLIVLPEMFNTGYSMDSNAIAEPKDGATLNWMKQISSRFEVGICGSIAYQRIQEYIIHSF
jgi:Predicted amidohydrolase